MSKPRSLNHRKVGSLQARPTVYKGIHMRSRLEATYAAIMDNDGFCWEFEPECFADETGQYLPDFLRWDPENPPTGTRGEYVEVKPSAAPGPATREVLRRMEIIWSSKPDALLTLWTPKEMWFATPPHWDPPEMQDEDPWAYLPEDDDGYDPFADPTLVLLK